MNLIEERINHFKEELDFFEEDMQKYEYIIDLGKGLKPIDPSYKTPENLVEGCSSRVWIIAELKDNRVSIQADSEAIIVKGLIHIVTAIFSDASKEEILAFDLDLLKRLNLSEIITPSRQNGVLGMIKKIKHYVSSSSD